MMKKKKLWSLQTPIFFFVSTYVFIRTLEKIDSPPIYWKHGRVTRLCSWTSPFLFWSSQSIWLGHCQPFLFLYYCYYFLRRLSIASEKCPLSPWGPHICFLPAPPPSYWYLLRYVLGYIFVFGGDFTVVQIGNRHCERKVTTTKWHHNRLRYNDK